MLTLGEQKNHEDRLRTFVIFLGQYPDPIRFTNEELAQKYSCSISTIRRMLFELSKRGELVTVVKRGKWQQHWLNHRHIVLNKKRD